jgi:diguanylate cyclase (GGDEF)-like protein/putative nucleotidyltransferase with HDIG domain/PAS domain S-box-containing protein
MLILVYDLNEGIYCLVGLGWGNWQKENMMEKNGFDQQFFSGDFIDRLPLLVVGLDSSGKVVFWNSEAEKITGYKKNEILNALPPAFVKNLISSNKKLLTDHEQVILTRDGKEKVIIWDSSYQKDHRTSEKVLVFTGKDITPQKIYQKDLIKKTRYIETARSRLRKYLSLDPHTGILNYRHFINLLNAEFYQAVETNEPLSLLLLNANYFKSINSIHGVSRGNQILRSIAQIVKQNISTSCSVARFSGTEFAVLMPGAALEEAFRDTVKLFTCLCDHDFDNKNGMIPVNLSTCMALGGYPYCEGVSSPEQLLDTVVDKLKEARHSGGNSILLCSPEDSKSHLMLADDNSVGYSDEYKYTMEFVNALANVVKAKDLYTQEHSAIMSNYAADIAQHLGMNDEEIQNVRMGAVLHDLGKISIDKLILLKPETLTPVEFDTIRQHPRVGAEIIRSVHPLKEVVPYVLYHHEKYDGSGYLEGLNGEEIPLGARIISLADVFQALTSNRPYRRALPEKTAFGIIKDNSGKHFDPKVVKSFFDVYHS